MLINALLYPSLMASMSDGNPMAASISFAVVPRAPSLTIAKTNARLKGEKTKFPFSVAPSCFSVNKDVSLDGSSNETKCETDLPRQD